mmetsp:Transcript_72107/g.143008  ORF Transcript_72107/g.143008 Transcript_72107/m.143008 type:complete len:102 (-) Transcript_72107:1246-1551(-)
MYDSSRVSPTGGVSPDGGGYTLDIVNIRGAQCTVYRARQRPKSAKAHFAAVTRVHSRLLHLPPVALLLAAHAQLWRRAVNKRGQLTFCHRRRSEGECMRAR